MKITWRSILLLSLWLAIAIAEALVRLNHYLNTQEVVVSWLADAWIFYSIILTSLLVWELFSLGGIKELKISRGIAQTLPVNHFSKVVLTIENLGQRNFIGNVFDHVPAFCMTKNLPQRIELHALQSVKIEYQIKALQRGELKIDHCEIWINSEFSMLSKRVIFECASVSKIYPNYHTLQHYLMLATQQQTQQLGIRQRQQRGDGLEFHQLREYRMGDTLRQIDWRASSRLQKMISKEYQQERDQNIIFILDSGRRMRTKDQNVSHFDQALNAVLLLSSIALQQGDAVGLNVFGGKDLFLLPKKGRTTINTLLNQVYDLHSNNNASDLIKAVEKLNNRFKKRSLVIIVSSFRVEESLEIKTATGLLKKNHLVMLVNLQEQALQETLDNTIYQLEDAIKFAQTINYMQQRFKLHHQLASDGVVLVDSQPKDLAINLVNQYFDIKRSGRL